MSWFGKRKPAPQLSGNAADDLTLQQIVEHGGDLKDTRHWVHFLYFPDESTARDAAGSIKDSGWDLQNVDRAATDDGQWIVISEQHDVIVNAQSVREARGFFERVVGGVPGANYDGWEASL